MKNFKPIRVSLNSYHIKNIDQSEANHYFYLLPRNWFLPRSNHLVRHLPHTELLDFESFRSSIWCCQSLFFLKAQRIFSRLTINLIILSTIILHQNIKCSFDRITCSWDKTWKNWTNVYTYINRKVICTWLFVETQIVKYRYQNLNALQFYRFLVKLK